MPITFPSDKTPLNSKFYIELVSKLTTRGPKWSFKSALYQTPMMTKSLAFMSASPQKMPFCHLVEEKENNSEGYPFFPHRFRYGRRRPENRLREKRSIAEDEKSGEELHMIATSLLSSYDSY